MEKKRVIPFERRAKYSAIEETRRVMMDTGKLELATNRPQLHSYRSKAMNEPLEQQQNIWRSRVLSSGAHNQPWFDKLQEYRNEV
ncbi:hypothetical protein ABIC22_002785 [Paenibacillus sp. PvP094]|uniref:hypothetical protein n=1 Tax=Paenibacillus sp. PvP094 TaxID=3156394 RepID=UPI00339B91C8